MYFGTNFSELVKFCVPLKSHLLLKIDIVSRCLIRYNTLKKIKKRDHSNQINAIIDVALECLDNGIWGTNNWWYEHPNMSSSEKKENGNNKSNFLNPDLTFQYTNLKIILNLFEYSVFPIEKIDILIVK